MPSLTAAQHIEPPVMTDGSISSSPLPTITMSHPTQRSPVVNSNVQETGRTVPVYQAQRLPAVGRLRGSRDNSCQMSPVTPEENKRIEEFLARQSQGSNEWFGFDKWQFVLIAIIAVLVGVILILVFRFVIPSKEPVVPFRNSEESLEAIDDASLHGLSEIKGIDSYKENKLRQSFEKGGK